MKKYLFLLLTFLSINTFAQIEVKEGSFHKINGFVMLEKDEHIDMNNAPMALIKISTENISAEQRRNFTFKGNAITYFDVKFEPGEIHLYISAAAATFLEIIHDEYGKTEYTFPETLCDYCGYEMVLQRTKIEPDYGFLAISSEPDEAEIYIDGKYYGKTPSFITDLEDGTHSLRLSKDAYVDIIKDIVIIKGETLKLNEKLHDINSQRTYLIVKADQSNAMIYIDDKPISTGEASVPVMMGTTHTYKIEYNLYHTETGSVTISERTTIEKQLRPAFGYLNISTTPEQGAKVFVDGEYIGISPIKTDKIESGSHTVRVMKESYNMAEKTFTVDDGQTISAIVEMSVNSVNVTVKTDPQSDIYIDNEYKAKGQWSGHLSEGAHLLEARKINHISSKKNVNLMLGKDETITLEAPTPINGSLDVNTSPLGADIYIDGVHYGQTPNFINDIIIGTHELKIVKTAYKTITKNIVIKEGETLTFNEKMVNDVSHVKETKEVQDVKVRVKKSFEKKTFFGLNVAYSVAPQMSYGLTFGQFGKIGWYFSAMSNFNFDAMGSEYECDEYGKIDGNIVFYNEETASTRISVGAGALYRIAKPVCLKAGVGYGLRDIAWQDVESRWIKNTYYSYKGLEFDAGLMFSFGMVNASLDGLVNIGGKTGPSLEFKLGLGINF